MKVTEAFKGNYLEALHLDGGKAVLEISKVADPNTVQAADKKLIDKPILYFTKTDKGLIVNKTNAKAIARVHGNEMDGWVGKSITLFATTCEAFGEKGVPCIRVRVERGSK
jgi:hypothetical protein